MLTTLIVGLTLTLFAHIMKIILLKERIFWSSTFMDFGVATLIVFIVTLFFVDAEVTFFGALVTNNY